MTGLTEFFDSFTQKDGVGITQIYNIDDRFIDMNNWDGAIALNQVHLVRYTQDSWLISIFPAHMLVKHAHWSRFVSTEMTLSDQPGVHVDAQGIYFHGSPEDGIKAFQTAWESLMIIDVTDRRTILSSHCASVAHYYGWSPIITGESVLVTPEHLETLDVNLSTCIGRVRFGDTKETALPQILDGIDLLNFPDYATYGDPERQRSDTMWVDDDGLWAAVDKPRSIHSVKNTLHDAVYGIKIPYKRGWRVRRPERKNTNFTLRELPHHEYMTDFTLTTTMGKGAF